MVKQLAHNVIDALRAQPLALALVIINLMFLIGFGFALREVGQAIERRDNVIARLANCADGKRGGLNDQTGTDRAAAL